MKFSIPIQGFTRLPKSLVDPVHLIPFPAPFVPSTSVIASDAYFYGAMARAIGPRADAATFQMHRSALHMLFSRFVETSHGDIRIDFGGSSHIPLIDFMRNTFTGLIGYGSSILCAMDFKYVWFSHYEDVRDSCLGVGDFNQHHAPYDHISVKKTKNVTNPAGPPPYRIKRPKGRRPDLFGVKQDGTLGVLECKATLQDAEDFWKSTIFPAFMEQAEPMLGAKIAGVIVNESAVLCGKFENGTGASIYGLSASLPHIVGSSPFLGATIHSTLVASHYAQWFKMMNGVFWDLADNIQGPSDLQISSQGLGVASIVIDNIGIDISYSNNINDLEGDYIFGIASEILEILREYASTDMIYEDIIYESNGNLIENKYWRPNEEQSLKFTENISNLCIKYSNFYRDRGSLDENYAIFPDGTVVIRRSSIELEAEDRTKVENGRMAD